MNYGSVYINIRNRIFGNPPDYYITYTITRGKCKHLQNQCSSRKYLGIETP